jgi:hypothetical protein
MSERDRPDLFPSLTRLARTKDGLACWIHSGYPRCNLDKADFALFRTNDGKWSTLAQVPVVYSMWECATVQRVAPIPFILIFRC